MEIEENYNTKNSSFMLACHKQGIILSDLLLTYGSIRSVSRKYAHFHFLNVLFETINFSILRVYYPLIDSNLNKQM